MRVFVSLPMPDAAQDALVRLQERLPKGRRVPPDDLHITLAFLGEIPAAEAEAAEEALETLRAPAVEVTLSGPALFGGKAGQAIGLEAEGGPSLPDLHDRVLSRLRGAGLAPERRRFRPHVTLARLPGRADASGCLQALLGARIGPVPCVEIRLVESRLHPDGAIHEPLAAYALDVPG